MTSELGILGLYALFVILVLLAQVAATIPQHGLAYLVGPRDAGRPTRGVAARLDRAVANCITGLVLLAPAVLILALRDVSTAGTLLASQLFLIARILYVPVYAAGVAWLRTALWGIDLLATTYLYLVPLLPRPAPA